MTNEEFIEKLQSAKKRVDAWPEWKKNILKESSKSSNDIPRAPVNSADESNKES